MAKNKIFLFKIKGKEWKARCYAPRTYTKMHGSDSAAITVMSDRELHFNTKYLSLDYIQHELWHAFTYESNTNSSYLSNDQMEELSATIFSNHGLEIIALSIEIQQQFLTKDEE